MKNYKYIISLNLALFILLFTSCEEWVEVDHPDHKLVSNEVFSSDETASAAMQGIYNQFYDLSYSRGWLGSVTVLSELSSDNLQLINTNTFNLLEFEEHNLLPDNSYNEDLWSSAYNMIYAANALLEGIEDSNEITPELSIQLEGEAKFIRAFTFFYLRHLYGEIPLPLTSDYEYNAGLEASSTEQIDAQIIDDLETAILQLSNHASTTDRTSINVNTAKAFLARIHLFLENWELAESYSSDVIAQNDTYSLHSNLDDVFLVDSQEAIWHISPLNNGSGLTHTNEGSVFIINPYLPFLSYLKLSEDLNQSMSAEDKRKLSWINYHEGLDVFYAYKYKVHNSTSAPTEYSMVLRLAEQYLIRAEARAQQNKLQGAIADVDMIKQRAGLPLLNTTNPGIGQQNLLEEIWTERRKELFAEWGHRWLDLKRLQKASELVPDYDDTDQYYPIPSYELLSHPNLSQNPGY